MASRKPKTTQHTPKTSLNSLVALVVAGIAVVAFFALRPTRASPSELQRSKPQAAADAQPLSYSFERLVDALPEAHHQALLWGTYRPGVYVGIKSRTYPRALVAGAMWAGHPRRVGSKDDALVLRHECREEDGLGSYGYRVHDGRSVGIQTIDDPVTELRLETSFVRSRAAGWVKATGSIGSEAEEDTGDEWALRISASRLHTRSSGGPMGNSSLFLYVALDEEGGPVAGPLPPPCHGRQSDRAMGRGGASGPDDNGLEEEGVLEVESGGADAGGSPELRAVGALCGLRHTADGRSGGGSFELVLGGVPSGMLEGSPGSTMRVWHLEERLPLSQLGSRVLEELRANGGLLRETLTVPGRIAEAQAGAAHPTSRGRRARLVVLQVVAELPFAAQISYRATRPSSSPAAAAATTSTLSSGAQPSASDPGGGLAYAREGEGRSNGSSSRSRARLLEAGALERAASEAEAAFALRFQSAFGVRLREDQGGAEAAADAGQAASARLLLGSGSRALGLSASELALSKRTLALLLGSHAYLFGPSRLRSTAGEGGAAGGAAVLTTGGAPLFTGVPSRSFFPRGFLWDDGFHQLVVCRFDRALSLDALLHWAGLVQPDGWLAREQILGSEARARVPDEFVTQEREVANPPTLLLLLESLVSARRVTDGGDGAEAEVEAGFDRALGSALPALERWFAWLLRTQAAAPAAATAAGASEGAGSGGAQRTQSSAGYYWRGRSASDGRLNAMTLSSGLDDYPRATEPGPEERHLDLLCWLAAGSRALATAARALPSYASSPASHYEAVHAQLLASLVAVHWDERARLFSDVGVTSNDGTLVEHVVVKCERPAGRAGQQPEQLETDVSPERMARAQQGAGSPCPSSHPRFLFPLGDGKGGLLKRTRLVPKAKPKLGHVRTVGYVSLFPLMLRLVPAHSDALGALLDVLTDPTQLWSDHGLRSLSLKDRMYGVPNAPGDAPYWRGPVWINCNYLALAGLHHYASVDGPHAQRARAAYEQLRVNLVRTVLGELDRTGFLFEQYDPVSGKGQRTRPFNGWTTLILLALAEIY